MGTALVLLATVFSDSLRAAEDPEPADHADAPAPLPDYTKFTILHTAWLKEITPPRLPAAAEQPAAGPYPPSQGAPYYRAPSAQTAQTIFVENYPNLAELSADGQWLLTVRATDTTAQVWDLQRGKLAASLQVLTGKIYAAAISPDGSQALTCSDDGVTILWDVASGSEMKRLMSATMDKVYFVSAKQMAWVHRKTYSPLRYQLEICSLPNLAPLITLNDVIALEVQAGRLTAAAIQADGSRCLYGHDGQKQALEKIVPNDTWRLDDTRGEMDGVASSSDGQFLVFTSESGQHLDWFNLTTQWSILRNGLYRRVLFTADGKYAILDERINWHPGLPYNNTTLIAIHSDTYQVTTRWQFNPSPVSWALSPRQKSIAVSKPGAVEVYGLSSSACIGALVSARDSAPATKILFPANLSHILLCFENRIETWGPEVDPLPRETDRAWTVYMDQLGLKHSLFTAAVYASPAEIEALIAAHPDWLTQVDEDGGTPLHYAVAAGRLDAVEALLQAGSDPNRPDMQGTLPLKLAFADGNLAMLRLLEKHGAQVPAEWGSEIHRARDFSPQPGRRYARILLQTRIPPITHEIMVDWLADHDLTADPRSIAREVHRLEDWNNRALAQKVYNRFQRIPIYWLALMQLLLIAVALARAVRQYRQAQDPEKQKANAEALRIRVYHESSWGDDAKGQLGLYPEEQRRLAELRHARDGVLAAPLPMLLAYIGVIAVAAVIPYWWIEGLIGMNTILLLCLGLSWIFGHLQNTRMRIAMHGLGLLTGVVGCVYGLLVALLLPGIQDFYARWTYAVAGLAAIPLLVLYARNLKLLNRIARMEDQLASVVVHSNEEVKSETGWDEKHPEVF